MASIADRLRDNTRLGNAMLFLRSRYKYSLNVNGYLRTVIFNNKRKETGYKVNIYGKVGDKLYIKLKGKNGNEKGIKREINLKAIKRLDYLE